MDIVVFIKVISLLIYPIGLSLLLILLGCLLSYLKRQTIAIVSASTGIIILLLASNPILADRLAASLEQQYPQKPLESLPKSDAIVVLGGGLRLPLPPLQHTQITAGSDRYWYAARLYKAGKAHKIILSGGNVHTQKGYQGEAYYAAQLLSEWGIPEHAISIEQSSRTTAQNAQQTEEFLVKQKINSVLLVTSALHMPRAYQLFSRLPLHITPASADVLVQQVKRPTVLNWLPSAHALLLTTVSLHEYYGMLANRLFI